MVLDCGFRRNDNRLGAMNRAPTKNLPLSGITTGPSSGRPAGLGCLDEALAKGA